MASPDFLDRLIALEDKIAELENKLEDTVHTWLDLFEIWKKRENENHLLLLDTLENVKKIVKHIEAKKAPSGPSPYL